MKEIIIQIPEKEYEWINTHLQATDYQTTLSLYEAMRKGIVFPENATRKDVHKILFGIEPPELGSPYCACANANGGKGCETCQYKDDINCDVNWWNETFSK